METGKHTNIPVAIGQIAGIACTIRSISASPDPDNSRIYELAREIDEKSELVFDEIASSETRLAIAYTFLAELRDDYRTSEYVKNRIIGVINRIENYGNETK